MEPRNNYGVIETNPVSPGYFDLEMGPNLSLAGLVAAGGTLLRVRLLTEPGYPGFDLSYCHGILPDGRKTNIVGLRGRYGVRTYRSELQNEAMTVYLLTKTQVNNLGIWKDRTYSLMYG